jgi:C4-dicarboxylate-specific signal transduction histidine kinase
MGMGLAASKSLAQALGGDLNHERSSLGGARFVLLLPIQSTEK